MSGFSGGGLNLIQQLDAKESVRVVVPVNVADLDNPGGTLDGVALAAGNRILLSAQGTAAENGLYVWSGAAETLVRTEDADSNAELDSGATVFVEEGTKASTKYSLVTANPIVVGTTGQSWSQTGGAPYTDSQAIAAVEDEVTLDLDGGRVGIGGVADGAEKRKVTGNIVVTGTGDGVDVATRDHARYADAEAIAAVEGEGTLALSGAVSMGGLVAFKRVAKANADTPYTVLATDYIIGCNTSVGVLEIDLPAAETGRVLMIKDEGGVCSVSNITIDPNGSEQIDGGGAGTPLVMSTNDQSFSLYGVTGTGWFIF